MTICFSIPTPSGPMEFQVEAGSSLLFVGANGSGKTRLAVKIEETMGLGAHRISAHRALKLNPNIAKINQVEAMFGLTTGLSNEGAQVVHRSGNRWGGNAATSLLNDYDFLLQALFAEQANKALKTHKDLRAGRSQSVLPTKFELLEEIWNRLLPHRKLEISGDNIKAYIDNPHEAYSAAELSDGERAIFYLIGQTLIVSSNTLIIFDEPELHIHRSIMSLLWDELEAARPDCGFIFISHDLEFVASRGGQKFVLRNFDPSNGWTIEAVPQDTGFAEEIATLILGSRKPVLFVEGAGTSLDKAIFRACYPEWTVIPRGSCEAVLHSVITLRANASLTRVACCGIVDADDYDESEKEFFQKKGIAVLPVSEIENIFLLPEIVTAITETEGYRDAELIAKCDSVYSELLTQASDEKNQKDVILRYCRRRIDRTLKKIDLSEASDIGSICTKYTCETTALDINGIAQKAKIGIESAITQKNIYELLKWYDNKGNMSIACKAKNTTKPLFEQWIVRVLRNNIAPELCEIIKNKLPSVVPE